jgi:nitrile hydratase
MNSVHDLGGMDGFGPVEMEPNEPTFHHPWERRACGMTLVTSAALFRNVHRFRHAIERMEPAHYLASSYYEHWITAVATLLVETGTATRAELESSGGNFGLAAAVRGAPPREESSGAMPRFALGDAVRVRNMHPSGHTRCPRYVRGRSGVIVRVDGRYPLPDVAAHSSERCEQFAYSVRFQARELWGEEADHSAVVHVDLWESYLEAP